MLAKKSDPDIKQVKALLKELNIKHSFNWSQGRAFYTGKAVNDKIYIYSKIGKLGKNKLLYRKISKDEFFTTIFHEIQHILMLRHGKYKEYHQGFDPKRHNFAYFMKWAEQSLHAERAADILGRKMMKKHFPKLNFIDCYIGDMGEAILLNTIETIWLYYFENKEYNHNNILKTWRKA